MRNKTISIPTNVKIKQPDVPGTRGIAKGKGKSKNRPKVVSIPGGTIRPPDPKPKKDKKGGKGK